MPSSLYRLARTISEYARQRHSRSVRQADDAIRRNQPSEYIRSRRNLAERFRKILFGDGDNEDKEESGGSGPRPPGDSDQREGAPPVDLREIWPGTPGAPESEPEYDDIQLLGRDAGYDEGDFDAIMSNLRRTEGSSNVYGYFFERESRRTGIMYVTFLGGRGQDRHGPGPTYAYYDVPVKKALEFQRATAVSAGEAIWDYFRIRGTAAGHQHQYRLVHVSGEYVPRKVTPVGYRNRAVPNLGVGRRGFRRNTLPPMRFGGGAEPDRGEPDRGELDRG